MRYSARDPGPKCVMKKKFFRIAFNCKMQIFEQKCCAVLTRVRTAKTFRSGLQNILRGADPGQNRKEIPIRAITIFHPEWMLLNSESVTMRHAEKLVVWLLVSTSKIVAHDIVGFQSAYLNLFLPHERPHCPHCSSYILKFETKLIYTSCSIHDIYSAVFRITSCTTPEK